MSAPDVDSKRSEEIQRAFDMMGLGTPSDRNRYIELADPSGSGECRAAEAEEQAFSIRTERTSVIGGDNENGQLA